MLKMIGRFLEWFIAPVIGDPVKFKMLADRHPMRRERPGTVREAKELLDDVLYVYASSCAYDVLALKTLLGCMERHMDAHKPDQGWCACGWRFDEKTPDALIGRFNQVSFLFDPKHCIGLEIAEGDDGWRKARFESLQWSLDIIVHGKRIRGVEWGVVMRHEAKSGVRVG